MNPDWDGVMKGKAREANPVKSPRPVVEASGDRSLLRAPTEPSAAAIEAVARELFTRRQPAAKWPGPYSEQGQRLFREDARSLLKIAYAVDGLRGTEDRLRAYDAQAIRDAIQSAWDDYTRGCSPAEFVFEAGAGLVNLAAARVFTALSVRESVEGEQRT